MSEPKKGVTENGKSAGDSSAVEISVEDTKKIEQAKQEVAQAEKELKAAQAKLREKKALLKAEIALQEAKTGINPRASAAHLEYEVNEDMLHELCRSRTPIRGINELLRKVLTVTAFDKENPKGYLLNLDDVQISQRIRRDGVRAIEYYCELDKASLRKIFIKSIKNLETRPETKVNLRELNRQLEVEEKLGKLRALKNKNNGE
jgi:hypothetical protein